MDARDDLVYAVVGIDSAVTSKASQAGAATSCVGTHWSLVHKGKKI